MSQAGSGNARPKRGSKQTVPPRVRRGAPRSATRRERRGGAGASSRPRTHRGGHGGGAGGVRLRRGRTRRGRLCRRGRTSHGRTIRRAASRCALTEHPRVVSFRQTPDECRVSTPTLSSTRPRDDSPPRDGPASRRHSRPRAGPSAPSHVRRVPVHRVPARGRAVLVRARDEPRRVVRAPHPPRALVGGRPGRVRGARPGGGRHVARRHHLGPRRAPHERPGEDGDAPAPDAPSRGDLVAAFLKVRRRAETHTSAAPSTRIPSRIYFTGCPLPPAFRRPRAPRELSPPLTPPPVPPLDSPPLAHIPHQDPDRDLAPETYASRVAARRGVYNGFNLVVGRIRRDPGGDTKFRTDFWYVGNRGAARVAPRGGSTRRTTPAETLRRHPPRARANRTDRTGPDRTGPSRRRRRHRRPATRPLRARRRRRSGRRWPRARRRRETRWRSASRYWRAAMGRG